MGVPSATVLWRDCTGPAACVPLAHHAAVVAMCCNCAAMDALCCFLQSGGCDPYFLVKVTTGVLKDFTVFDYRLHVPKKKVLQINIQRPGAVTAGAT